MKKSISLFLILFISVSTLHAQKLQKFKDEKTKKLGIKDENDKVIKTAKYDQIELLAGGLAKVFIGDSTGNECGYDMKGKWGLINQKGEEITPVKYVRIDPFSEGMAAVVIGSYRAWKWGFIDSTGKEIVSCQYNLVGDFYQGLAGVTQTGRYADNCSFWDGKYGFIDKTGKIVIPLKYESATNFTANGTSEIELNGKKGFIDTKGKEIISAKYSSISVLKNGYYKVSIKQNKTIKYGVVDPSGKEIIAPQYDDISLLNENFFKVRTNQESSSLFGVRDRTGKALLPNDYSVIYSVTDGMVIVNENQKIVGIKADGTKIPFEIYADGFFVQTDIDKVGLMDSKYNVLVPPVFDNYRVNDALSFSEGIAYFRMNKKYGFITKTGKEIIAPKYDEAKRFIKGKAVVKLNDRWGMIDSTDKIVLDFNYNEFRLLSDDLYLAIKESKYGFVKTDGTEMSPCINSDFNFYENLTTVKLDNNKYGIINKNGIMSKTMTYEYVGSFQSSVGLAIVKREGKYGCINTQGEEVIPAIYADIAYFKDGKALVKTGKNGKKSFYIDKTGKVVE
jgi:hypothetical protein